MDITAISELLGKVYDRRINPLHELVLRAEISAGVASVMAKDGEQLVNLGDNWICSIPPGITTNTMQYYNGQPLLENREMGGLFGLFSFINQQEGWETVFCNDFSLFIHGIDAIAYNSNTDTYYLCEAKGSTRQFQTPISYLKKTRKKGRQLSWEWIWLSLEEFALSGYAAPIFLSLYKRMIKQERVKRLLAVTQLKPQNNCFLMNETRVWHEEDLVVYPFMSKEYGVSELQGWLQEMERYQAGSFVDIVNDILNEQLSTE